MRERKRRSIAKAISWRVLASIITMSLVFIFTGRLLLSLEIGFTEIIVKMAFYFVHERTWLNIGWGTY